MHTYKLLAEQKGYGGLGQSQLWEGGSSCRFVTWGSARHGSFPGTGPEPTLHLVPPLPGGKTRDFQPRPEAEREKNRALGVTQKGPEPKGSLRQA